MHTLRRLSLVSASALMLVLPLGVQAFSDTATSLYQDSIEALSDRDIVHGYGDNTFRPEQTINRAEFLHILMESRFPNRTPQDLRCFRDLDVKTPQWYARTTCMALELGIVSGYSDGTFKPDAAVNLAEALKMAMRSFQINTDSFAGDTWYDPYLREARNRDILIPLLSKPDRRLTRGEMASLTYSLVLEQEDPRTNTEKTASVCGNGVTEQAEQCDDGNVQDGDGCSSICISVEEPVRLALLQIDQQTTGSFQNVARGQTALPLLKFTAVAGRQDAILTELTFKPSVGSLLYGQHYTLAMDRDGDGVYEKVVQTEGKVTSGRLTFDSFIGGGVALPAGLVVPFVVRADLVATLGPVSLGLEFATDQTDYVRAQGATDSVELEGIETNGTCSARNCFIRVNTIGSRDINVQTRGNLTITEDSMPVRSRILVGGSITPELLRLRLHADSEAIDLSSIRIDGVPQSVEHLLVYVVAPGQGITGASPIAQMTHGQCPEESLTRFCAALGLRTIVVPPTSDQVLVIAAKLKNDHLGALSGELMTLTVSADTVRPAFRARGTLSNEELAQNDGDSVAEGELFVGTSSLSPNMGITGKTNDIALASLSSVQREGIAEDRPIPVGMQTIGAFRLSALPHTNSLHGSNNVEIQSFTFQVTAQNVQMDPLSLKLSSAEDPAATLPCSASASTGTFSVVCSGLAGSIAYRIEQGEFAIYKLSAFVTNPQITESASVLTVTLPVIGQRNQTNSISWSDGVTVFPWVDAGVTSVQGTIFRQ